MRNLGKVKRVVIKIGSSSLVNEDLSINDNVFDTIMKSFRELMNLGISPTLVSSGAIAVGMHELGMKERPKDMSLKQACASVGQAKLMEIYNRYAKKYSISTGQILLSHDDFQYRVRMLHLIDTFDAMFNHGIVPIINENDALAVEEIKLGDNDTLSSMIAPLVHADLLILFSDIDGLYDKNPHEFKDAKMIPYVDRINKKIMSLAGNSSSSVGTGGMKTKIKAAIISTSASCDMIICNSNRIKDLLDIVSGEEIGTLFIKQEKAISSREHWMIFRQNSSGYIVIDDGLKKALKEKKVSILPKGIVEVKGDFLKNSVIDLKDLKGCVVAKGITKFSSLEIERIKGLDSRLIDETLGHKGTEYVIHANDLVIVGDLAWKNS